MVTMAIIGMSSISPGNAAWDDIEYLKCRGELIFEVDYGANSAIDAIATKWDLILLG